MHYYKIQNSSNVINKIFSLISTITIAYQKGEKVIIIDNFLNILNIFCLTEWHVEYMTNIYPELKELIVSFYYGIDFTNFKNNSITKIKNKFILF